jgi:hypothetical protein
MKLIKNFILLFAAIIVFEFTFVKDANAACAETNGVLSETEIKNGCETAPDLYEIVIYKMYLCTSSPTLPTTTTAVDLTNCSQIFNNNAGATASVAQNAEVDLTGTYTRPPDDTYTHGYAMMNNTFGITASFQIDGAMDGQAGGTGVFCRTVAGSGTHSSTATHNDESVCSSTQVAAGKYTETLTHFGGVGEAWTAQDIAENINGTSASITGILVDSSGNLAAVESEVDKLEGLVAFANPLSVNANTTSLTMSFNLGEGMSLNRAGADVIYIGSGPFQAIMTAN